MLRTRPFQGLRPAPPLVAQVACVPYDVVDREESAALAAGNPHSLLHVDRAEIDLPPETDPVLRRGLRQGAREFHRLAGGRRAHPRDRPRLYLYQQSMGAHVQTGLAAALPHRRLRKRTHQEAREDPPRQGGRPHAAHRHALRGYRPRVPDLPRRRGHRSARGRGAKGSAALRFHRAGRHPAHRLARSSTPGASSRPSARCPCSYVADGHHRTASAVRVGKERREANPEPHRQRGIQLVPRRALSRPASCRSCPTTAACTICTGRTPGAFLAELRRVASPCEPAASAAPPTPGRGPHVPGPAMVSPRLGAGCQRPIPSRGWM